MTIQENLKIIDIGIYFNKVQHYTTAVYKEKLITKIIKNMPPKIEYVLGKSGHHFGSYGLLVFNPLCLQPFQVMLWKGNSGIRSY